MTSSCGSRVWSMISTTGLSGRPSAASQIVRIARPATFIGGLPLQHPPGDRVEPGEEARVAAFGRGDQRVFERAVAALAAGPVVARQQWPDLADQGAGPSGLGVRDPQG